MFFRLNLDKPLEFSTFHRYTNDEFRLWIQQTTEPLSILFIDQGNLSLLINETTEHLNNMNWLLLPKDYEIKISNIDKDFTCQIISFNSENNIITSFSPFLNEKSRYGMTIPQIGKITNKDSINGILKNIFSTKNQKNQLELNINYLISNLLVTVSTQFIQVISDNQQKPVPAKFDWILNWITTHIEDSLNVTDIADKFDITPEYLTHLFNKYQNVSTIKFINQMKISKAKDLLITTNLSIKQIALYLNFQNIKYFMRLFKQETSLTPTKFRNMYSTPFINSLDNQNQEL
ncbi:transcriptional regulator, AraC family [Paucilactobacillus oligofermentans DSM 15707 = LMG 22743]|uniref:Transcriptional regulator, AraC family n=1 Tax=Paucilactobacillus oligofermentans DSM 15707 = LMG 22743 TaxID=1423778 RepID=A0A0R1RMM0_9LACO|nr:AraC family transcriptional regulator [Paucilactobacillus oligofermentans]KRL55442.1 transcriptional regulator, AraC family [Paucilactobacillus oligofermentans DSM 15707 = LMG 22743]CUS25573.1 AraC-type DNA-binding domain-containing protein [Paucilactobacillus oligofermentans DSM 15707 = LMG 22743]